MRQREELLPLPQRSLCLFICCVNAKKRAWQRSIACFMRAMAAVAAAVPVIKTCIERGISTYNVIYYNLELVWVDSLLCVMGRYHTYARDSCLFCVLRAAAAAAIATVAIFFVASSIPLLNPVVLAYFSLLVGESLVAVVFFLLFLSFSLSLQM